MEYILLALVIGAVAGALRIGLGYLKHSDEETFETQKAIRTLGIAIIEGGLIGIFYPIADLKTLFAIVFMGTVALEEILTAIIKRM